MMLSSLNTSFLNPPSLSSNKTLRQRTGKDLEALYEQASQLQNYLDNYQLENMKKQPIDLIRTKFLAELPLFRESLKTIGNNGLQKELIFIEARAKALGIFP